MDENQTENVIVDDVEKLQEAPETIVEVVKDNLVIFKFIANIGVLYLGQLPAVALGMMGEETEV